MDATKTGAGLPVRDYLECPYCGAILTLKAGWEQNFVILMTIATVITTNAKVYANND
jgi:hypothetical protein